MQLHRQGQFWFPALKFLFVPIGAPRPPRRNYRLAEVLEDEGLLATLDRMASEASPSPTTKRRAARPSPTRK